MCVWTIASSPFFILGIVIIFFNKDQIFTRPREVPLVNVFTGDSDQVPSSFPSRIFYFPPQRWGQSPGVERLRGSDDVKSFVRSRRTLATKFFTGTCPPLGELPSFHRWTPGNHIRVSATPPLHGFRVWL